MISIVVPAHNAARTLPKTLESLQDQTLIEWEAIVVDDGSTDLTYNIARSFGERDPRIWVIRLARNEGAARAINRALKWPVACGKYAVVLAADDYLLEDFAEKCVAALDASPLSPGVYTDYIEWFEAEGIKRIHRCPDFDRKTLLTRDFVNFSALVFRFVVPFNDHWTPVADWDAVIRMSKYRPLLHLPGILAVRRIHDRQVSQRRRMSMVWKSFLLAFRHSPLAGLRRLYQALSWPIVRQTFK